MASYFEEHGVSSSSSSRNQSRTPPVTSDFSFFDDIEPPRTGARNNRLDSLNDQESRELNLNAVMDLFERMRGRMERDALQEGVGPGGISAESGMILLDQLLMQLQMESNSHSGPPPASKAFIESIPSVDIKPGMDKECPICVEPFENLVAKQLPCKHRFHGGCVVPWLNSHNTCPICRREFPTDVQKVPPGSSMAEVHEAARAAVEENDPDWMYG